MFFMTFCVLIGCRTVSINSSVWTPHLPRYTSVWGKGINYVVRSLTAIKHLWCDRFDLSWIISELLRQLQLICWGEVLSGDFIISVYEPTAAWRSHLQDEDKVIDGFAALVQEVLRRALVVLVKLQLLDDLWVSEDPQQDLLCDLERAEQVHLWWKQSNQITLVLTLRIAGDARPPVARKRCAASMSWGEIFTLTSCLKAEKSRLFLLESTFFLFLLSAEETQRPWDQKLQRGGA